LQLRDVVVRDSGSCSRGRRTWRSRHPRRARTDAW
jgi:hypothetical protein